MRALEKAKALWTDETRAFSFRFLMARALCAPLPFYVGGRLPARILRSLGFSKVDPSVVMWSLPTLTGLGQGADVLSNLEVGRHCRFNIGCLLNLGAKITIGNNVGFGHHVVILTQSHTIGPPDRRSGKFYAKEVVIGDGCWIGARATILPGVTVGPGAVIAAGALVAHDVRPHTLVGGVPARELKELDDPQSLREATAMRMPKSVVDSESRFGLQSGLDLGPTQFPANSQSADSMADSQGCPFPANSQPADSVPATSSVRYRIAVEDAEPRAELESDLPPMTLRSRPA